MECVAQGPGGLVILVILGSDTTYLRGSHIIFKWICLFKTFTFGLIGTFYYPRLHLPRLYLYLYLSLSFFVFLPSSYVSLALIRSSVFTDGAIHLYGTPVRPTCSSENMMSFSGLQPLQRSCFSLASRCYC